MTQTSSHTDGPPSPGTGDATTAQHRERERFFGAAKLIAAITMLSRVAGLARDMLLSRLFGAAGSTDAFYLAFMIPNLFRRLFGEGALSAAFVPVFSETAERSGRAAAGALLANVLGLLGLLLCVLCLLTEAVLLVTSLVAPGDAARELLIGYAAIMLPFMVTICLLAIGSAALNCVGHFAYPAAAPILLNLVIIGGALAGYRLWPRAAEADLARQLAVVAVSVLLAGVVQVAVLAGVLRRRGLPLRPRLRPVEPGVRRIATLVAPMLLGLGVLQVNALLDKLIAWGFTASAGDEMLTVPLLGWTLHKPLQVGVITWVNYAERLYQFPLGVLAIALGTAVFPLFSRYAARGETENLRGSINRAMRLAIFEGLPSGVGLLLLAVPLAALLFEGHRFTADDARQTAHAVRFYGLGMWAFCAQQILLRAFYAQKDTVTPLKVACSIVGLNFALNLVLIWVPSVRHGAFGLSTSITASLNVLILAYILRRRLGRLHLRRLASSVARTALATAAMAAAVVGVRLLLVHAGAGRDLAVVGICVPTAAAVYLLVGRLLRASEFRELLGR